MVANEMKLGHPERTKKVEKGTRMYLLFLIDEALGSRDFGQVWSLLSLWVPEHPSDCVIIPLLAFRRRVKFRLKWIGKVLLGHGLGKTTTTFPIEEPELSTSTSIGEN